MKKETSSVQSRSITLQLSPEEFEMIREKLQSNGAQDINEYLRGLLLEIEMGAGCPEQSFADFLAVAIGIKSELNAIGKNFNQAVKRLHQNYYQSGMKDHLEFYDASQLSLLREVGEIKSILAKAYIKMSSQSDPSKKG